MTGSMGSHFGHLLNRRIQVGLTEKMAFEQKDLKAVRENARTYLGGEHSQ